MKIKPFGIRCDTLTPEQIEDVFFVFELTDGVIIEELPYSRIEASGRVKGVMYFKPNRFAYVGVDCGGHTRFYGELSYFGEGAVEISYEGLRGHLGLTRFEGLCDDFHEGLLEPAPMEEPSELSVESLVISAGLGITTYEDDVGIKYRTHLPALTNGVIVTSSKEELASAIEAYKILLKFSDINKDRLL